MSKLSVTQKLLLAFGTVFVMISFFGLFIFYSFNNLSSERSNVRDWLDSNVTVSGLSRNIAACQRNADFMVTSIGTPNNANWRSELHKNTQKVDEGFERYKQVINASDYDDEEERQGDLNTLNNEIVLWQEYKNKLATLEKLVETGNRDNSVAYLDGEFENSYEKIYSAVDKDVELCHKGLDDAVSASERKFAGFEDLMNIMFLLIGGILAFVVFIVYILVRDIKDSVDKIVTVTERAAQGDLSHDIQTDATDEFGTISKQFNSVMQHMRLALGNVQNAAQQVSDSAEVMQNNITKTGDLIQDVALAVTGAADNADYQKAAIGETESRIKNMEQNIEKSISAMRIGLESVQKTVEHAAVGNETATATVNQMNEIAKAVEESARIVEELGENSKEIGSIVEVISGIADQTNLLALNAAIEAARAGEHGRGFAVVAEEVRKLAESSQQSVQKIGQIIGTIQQTTENAVETMKTASKQVEEGRSNVESTGNSFSEIVNMIKIAEENSQQVMDLVGNMRAPIEDIVNRAGKISNMSIEIAKKMESISMATGEQSMSVVQLSENSGSLNDLAKNMETTVHEFQL